MEAPLAFTPVPAASNRHDGWTSERQRASIARLAEHGDLAAAARSVGMTPQSANRLRHRADAESFATAWDKALLQGRDASRYEAIRSGRPGWLAPVIRRGKIVGHRQRFDNRLLLKACYAHVPLRARRSCRFTEAFGTCEPAAIRSWSDFGDL